MKRLSVIFMCTALGLSGAFIHFSTENAFAASGKSLYKQCCQNCHGKRGSGGTSGLSIRHESRKELINAVRTNSAMSSIKNLSKSKLRKVWSYVHK